MTTTPATQEHEIDVEDMIAKGMQDKEFREAYIADQIDRVTASLKSTIAALETERDRLKAGNARLAEALSSIVPPPTLSVIDKDGNWLYIKTAIELRPGETGSLAVKGSVMLNAWDVLAEAKEG